jgi:glutathione S-transferase
MTQGRPILFTFGISHFCEKARWALDWHRIPYQEISWPIGVHRILAKRYGAKGTTLPILLDRATLVQGSGAIIDWTDQQADDNDRILTLADALEIEQRADRVIGVHVRRLSYAEMLPRSSRLVKCALFSNTSSLHRVIGNIMWPLTRRLMMRALDISPGAAADSRSRLEAELDWLDSKLADGRRYLTGGRFSRADVTVASLLAPFARPAQMPNFRDMSFPDSLIADCERWSIRPVMRWVNNQYETRGIVPMSFQSRQRESAFS